MTVSHFMTPLSLSFLCRERRNATVPWLRPHSTSGVSAAVDVTVYELVSRQEILCACSSTLLSCPLLSGWLAKTVGEAYSLVCTGNLRLIEDCHLFRHTRAFSRKCCMLQGTSSPRGPLGDGNRDAHGGCSLAKTHGQVPKNQHRNLLYIQL